MEDGNVVVSHYTKTFNMPTKRTTRKERTGLQATQLCLLESPTSCQYNERLRGRGTRSPHSPVALVPLNRSLAQSKKYSISAGNVHNLVEQAIRFRNTTCIGSPGSRNPLLTSASLGNIAAIAGTVGFAGSGSASPPCGSSEASDDCTVASHIQSPDVSHLEHIAAGCLGYTRAGP